MFNPTYTSAANSLMPSVQTVTLVTSEYTDIFGGLSEFFRSSRNAAIMALVGGLIIGAGVGICIHAFASRRRERVIYVERYDECLTRCFIFLQPFGCDSTSS